MSKERESRTVYSTETGDLRKVSSKIEISGAGPARDKKSDAVKVMLDTKGRRGKAMTVVSGIQHNPQLIESLAKDLKNLCGAGGTVEGKDILIQGDHRDRVVGKLQEMGYKVKRSG